MLYEEPQTPVATEDDGFPDTPARAKPPSEEKGMKIVQISGIHAEDGGLFRPDLMERVVEEASE